MLIEHLGFQGTMLESCFTDHGVPVSRDTLNMQALAWGLTLNLPNQLPGGANRTGQWLTHLILGEARREADRQTESLPPWPQPPSSGDGEESSQEG